MLQLGNVSRLLLAELARRADLLPGAGTLAFVDVDSTQRRVYGHAKQGAAFGHAKIQGKTVLVHGLNALAATVCTPQAAPVIAAARLRGGNASSARGAASLITEAVNAAARRKLVTWDSGRSVRTAYYYPLLVRYRYVLTRARASPGRSSVRSADEAFL